MKFGKVAMKISAFICTLLIGIELPIRTAKSQTVQPYVVFVNGWQNCCAWGMNALENRLINEMNAEVHYLPYSEFAYNAKSEGVSDDSQFLKDGEYFINNKLDRGRPLILIGHSFGGDSVLKLVPRITRRIQFVGVIDPVSTGGFRYPSKYDIPRNVGYFYNRWQENEPFPNNFKTNGTIPCSAQTCDQDSQFAMTNIDGKPITDKCGLLENCSTKQRKVGHQTLPTDQWIQRVIGDRIQKQLGLSSPIYKKPTTFIKSKDGPPEIYGFSEGSVYCHVTGPAQLDAYGGGKVVRFMKDRSLDIMRRYSKFIGECPDP